MENANKCLIFVLLSFFLCGGKIMQAQDYILTKKGDSIKAKVLTIEIDNITYKRYEILEGPDFVIESSEVKRVEFEDGVTVNLKNQPMANKNQNPKNETEKEPDREIGMVYFKDGSFFRVYFLAPTEDDKISFYLVGDSIENKVSIAHKDLLLTAKDNGEMTKYEIDNLKIPEPGEELEIGEMVHYKLGYLHAGIYFDEHKCNSTAFLVNLLTTPIGGLILTIVANRKEVKQANLGYPAAFLYNDLDYRKGYQAAAKKIRKRSYAARTVNFAMAYPIILFLFAN